MGSDSGGKCYAACLVVGKAGDFADPVGIPSFDLGLPLKSYSAASPVIAFPVVGVTYMACLDQYLVAFPVTTFPVTAFPVRCHGLESLLPNLLASLGSYQAGGLYFLGAACQGGGLYFLETVAVGAVVCTGVG